MMFGLFNEEKYTVKRNIANPDTGLEYDPSLYRIGVTPNGNTEFSVGKAGGHVTLCMTDDAVSHMIRLLAINISDSYTVTVTPVSAPPEDDLDPTDLQTDAI